MPEDRIFAVAVFIATLAVIVFVVNMFIGCNTPSSCRDACGCGAYPSKCTMFTTECSPNPVMLVPSGSAVIELPFAPMTR